MKFKKQFSEHNLKYVPQIETTLAPVCKNL